jgi:hypothetical protein
MMRSFKALGLALIAAFAMSAIAASVASANEFHSSATNTTLTVASNEDQKFLYEKEGKTVKCTKVGGSGTATAQTLKEVTFKPDYQGCTVDGIAFSSAQVSFNECDYTFTIDVAGKNEGKTHVACVGTSQITITVKVFGVSVCTFHIGKQTPKGVSDEKQGSGNIIVEPTETGIVGSRQGGSECGSASSTSGSYTGSVTILGEKTGTQEKVSIQVG